jgi:hypothetical protein
MGDMKNRTTRTFFVRKPEGKKPFGRHKRKLEDNIKIDIECRV